VNKVLKFLSSLVFLLFILWFDFNFISKFLIFDLRFSLLLLSVVVLHNFKQNNIEDWYLPLFLLGVVNDLILPTSYIGLTSFFLLSVCVAMGRLKEVGLLSFPAQIFIGDSIFYLLTASSIIAISGVNLTFLLLGSLLYDAFKLIFLNFVLQLFIIWIFNFGRNNV